MNITAGRDDCKIALEVFEGPLDLLLHLVRRDEIDIRDIRIERITAQYLDYLGMMRSLDLAVAGEFLVMAATLMAIKSRMLLPAEAPPEEGAEEEEEEADPRLDLVRRLVEYKKFKDAAGRLMERELMQGERFRFGGSLDAAGERDDAPALGDVGIFDLLTAFQAVLARAATEPLGHLEPIRWSVADKMEAIQTLVRRQSRVAFSRLFHARSARGEVIVTFLALLELLRLRRVTARQPAPFTEIEILPAEELRTEEAASPAAEGAADVRR